MNKKIGVLILFLLFNTFLYADRLFFTEFNLSYASVISPANLENNTTGTKDTMGIDARVGANLFKWVDVYAAGGFYFFIFNDDWQKHYTFYPVSAGLRINIFPENLIYPDLFFEYGLSISNFHTMFSDSTWNGWYYNFGIAANLNITDVSILTLRIERPTIGPKNDNDSEIHLIKATLGWKLYY